MVEAFSISRRLNTHFRKPSAVVNGTIYFRGGFRELPRLQLWLQRASWSLQVCLNGF